MAFHIPFEMIRTRWSARAHQSNQSHNGKISKAVPMTFKIHRIVYSVARIISHFVFTSLPSDRKNYHSPGTFGLSSTVPVHANRFIQLIVRGEFL